MNWILQQYKGSVIYYSVFSAVFVVVVHWLVPDYYTNFVLSWLFVMVSSYVWLTIIIVARVIWATIMKNIPKKS